jgi:hypothetical protein
MKLSTAVRLMLLRVTLTAATFALRLLEDAQACNNYHLDKRERGGQIQAPNTVAPPTQKRPPVRVTSAQVAAAKLIIKRAEWTQQPVRPAVRAIANARPSGAVTTKDQRRHRA